MTVFFKNKCQSQWSEYLHQHNLFIKKLRFYTLVLLYVLPWQFYSLFVPMYTFGSIVDSQWDRPFNVVITFCFTNAYLLGPLLVWHGVRVAWNENKYFTKRCRSNNVWKFVVCRNVQRRQIILWNIITFFWLQKAPNKQLKVFKL